MGLAKNFVCVKVDTGDDEEAAEALGAKGLPTIQIRDATGNLLDERVGYMNESEMVDLLEKRRLPPTAP